MNVNHYSRSLSPEEAQVIRWLTLLFTDLYSEPVLVIRSSG
jgi:hypothetical protein